MKTETEQSCPRGQKWLTLSLTTQHTHTRTHTKRSLALASWASVKSGIKGGRHAVALGRDHVAKSTTVGKGNRKSQQTRSSKLHLVNNEELPRISAE